MSLDETRKYDAIASALSPGARGHDPLRPAGLERRLLIGAAFASVFMSRAVTAQESQSATERMNEFGPENQAMAQRMGLWDVTETAWPAPGAAPESKPALVAERRMIGSMLQEILRPASAPADAAMTRMDLLTFNRVEGRWDYVSFDTRVPSGLMLAWSFSRGDDAKIVLTFQPFARAGAGSDVSGQMVRMEQIITYQGPDRDVKEQHFIRADGTGTSWLGRRYAYVRRR